MSYQHGPPTHEQKLWYADQNKLWLYLPGLFSLACLLTGMILFTWSHPSLIFYAPFVLLLTGYLVVSYFIGLFGQTFDEVEHASIVDDFRKKIGSVDIYLPCCGEPLEVLRDTYKHVALLDWEGFRVYVLDDKGLDEVRSLAQEYKFQYISRPDKGVLKKAGNLRYAFTRTNGEFILILDADFAPRPDFLRETIPYFFHDDKIAVVQSPQFFTVESLMTHVQNGAAYVQELFYRLIQVNRNTWGASICVGTNAVYRRKALEPFGGTAPIAYSEDLHTGFMLISSGWKIKYIPINLAKGLCPDNMYSFFVQQYRWCLGSFSLFISKNFWTAPISFMARLCYLSGMMFYIASAAGIFLTPIPGLIVIWCFPDKVHWYNLIFSIPSLMYGTLCIALWSRAEFGVYSLTMRIVSYWAYAFAIFDKLRGDLVPWIPTGATESKVERYRTFWIFYTLWSTATFTAVICGCARHMKSLTDYNFYPIILLTAFYHYLFLRTIVEE